MNARLPEPNEDDDIDPEEIQDAADETPTGVTPPEMNAPTTELTEWDEPPTASGTAAPKVFPGTDEADRDWRLAAGRSRLRTVRAAANGLQ